MPVLTCPDRKLLADYMFARLPAGERGEIDSHVEACPTCQSQLDTLSGSDTLASALRHANAPPADPDSEAGRVIARIEALGRDPSFAGSPASPGGPAASAPLGVIRDYQLLAKLGEGGMGAVYKALHLRLDKVVALKVLPEDRLSPEAVARFQREMKAVGKLDHPHIVRAMDAGEHAGRHFLVMEHVEGVDLSKVARRRAPLAVADACEIVRQAALGLQHAHEHGLVHRDIKPSNLMLTVPSAASPASGGRQPPVVKILDLGLALLNASTNGGAARDVTSTGQVMGTLDYMAPEQADDSHQVDIRADLYSLGATLYKLLTGQVPLAATPQDSPLKRLLALATQPPVPITRHRTDLPEGLTQLLDRLLAKDPAERPATPGELAAALTPFAVGHDLASLAGVVERPSQAVPASGSPSGLGRLDYDAKTDPLRSSALVDTDTSRAAAPAPAIIAPPKPAPLRDDSAKFPQPALSGGGRWPTWLIALAACGGLAAAAFGIWLIIRDRDGKEVARIQVPDGAQIVQDKDGKETPLVPQAPAEVKPKPAAPPADPPAVADNLPPPADPFAATSASLGEFALVREPAPLPGLKSWSVATKMPLSSNSHAAFRPDGKQVALFGRDSLIRISDTQSGKVVRVLFTSEPSERLAWHPDGKLLASRGFSRLNIWDVDRGALVGDAKLPAHNAYYQSRRLAWSPDGSMLAVTWQEVQGRLGGLGLLDATGKVVRQCETATGGCVSLVWSTDGTRIAFAEQEAPFRLRVYQLETLKVTLELEQDEKTSVADLSWSPDGKLIAGIAGGKQIRTWDAETGKQIQAIDAASAMGELIWSPDSEQIAAVAGDDGYGNGKLRFWNARSGELVRSGANIARPYAGGYNVAWSADRRLLVIPGTWETKLYETANGAVRQTWANSIPGQEPPIWSPDGTKLGNANSDVLRCWNFSDQPVMKPLGGNYGNFAAWSPDGKTILRTHYHHQSRLAFIDATTGAEIASIAYPELAILASMPVWSPNGELVAMPLTSLASVAVMNFKERKVSRVIKTAANQVAWSPDSKLLATGPGQDEGPVCIWNAETGEQVRELGKHRASYQAWSPDGKWLAVSSPYDAPNTFVYDTATWEVRHTLTSRGKALHWSKDSKRLRTLHEAVVDWSLPDGKELRRLNGAFGSNMASFSPRGDLVATEWSVAGATWIWESATGKVRGALVSLGGEEGIAISAEGHVRFSSPKAEEQVVYVGLTTDGRQITYTPAEFAQTYGWKNNPARVQLFDDRE